MYFTYFSRKGFWLFFGFCKTKIHFYIYRAFALRTNLSAILDSSIQNTSESYFFKLPYSLLVFIQVTVNKHRLSALVVALLIFNLELK